VQNTRQHLLRDGTLCDMMNCSATCAGMARWHQGPPNGVVNPWEIRHASATIVRMKTRLGFRQVAFALGIGALALAVTHAGAEVVGAEPSTGHLWSDIKSDTYDQRDHFAAGARRLCAKLDEQIQELQAKRVAMTTDTKEWDFNMKEVEECRMLLKGRIDELAKATTPEAWADAKDKIGEAWKRSQLAVDKMNSTRTS